MPGECAAEALLSSGEVDGTMVQQELESEKPIYDYEKYHLQIWELLAKAGDVDVVVLYFKKYYSSYLSTCRQIEKEGPQLARLIRVFDWSEIGEAVLESVAFSMALYLLNNLGEGAARDALLKMVKDEAASAEDEYLHAFDQGLLWKWIVQSEDKILFEIVTKKLTNADISLVGPSIRYFSQNVSTIGQEMRAVLAPIVVKRVEWLEDIEALDKKFTWEMPEASVIKPRYPIMSYETEMMKFKHFYEVANSP